MTSNVVFQLRDVIKVWAAPDEEFRLSVPQMDIRAGDQVAVDVNGRRFICADSRTLVAFYRIPLHSRFSARNKNSAIGRAARVVA